MSVPPPHSHRRYCGLAALLFGYPCHIAASVLLPQWGIVSILLWLLALGGGALFCAETLKRIRRG
jgi:hypothetical protein